MKEIESAVKKLPPEDFLKLAAWMDQHLVEAGTDLTSQSDNSGADWFRVYMECPGSFKIPPRKKQFYHPDQ